MSPEVKATVDPTEIAPSEASGMAREDESRRIVSLGGAAGALIINADDWGRDEENTNRTLDCIRRGTISSVSAMVFMEDSERASGIANEREVDAGLHLNYTTPFSGPAISTALADHQRRLSSYLLRSRFASVMYYPQLANSFEYVMAAQFEEYSRLYGRLPQRVDGHHHMHLCANVLFGKLIPEGTIVRRNFSFQAGEKGLANRLYRSWVDQRLSQHYRLTDFFFSIEPVEDSERLRQIFSYARQFRVEVETHPINPAEYRFLQSGELLHELGGGAVAPRFEILPRQESGLQPKTARIAARDCDRGSASRPVVLVGFAEAASAPEVVWSLVDAGCDVIAFARKGRKSALRHSRHVICHEICAPETNINVCLTELQALLTSVDEKADRRTGRVLLPLDDKAVLIGSKVARGDGWFLAGPEGAQADFALNKALQVEFACSAGFNVPETHVAHTGDEVKEFTAAVSYPIILKSSECVPLDGVKTKSSHNWICANEVELNAALSEWKEANPLLVQPFILGIGEGIFGFAAGDGVRAWSGHRRLRMMNPQGSGSSACISQSVPEDLRKKALELIERTGWRGMFMVELLRERSGKLWFVEFNGRSWGSMALSRRQGLDYPAWQVALAIDPTSKAGSGARSEEGIVARNIGRDLMHLLFVLRGPKSKALAEWPSFWSSLAGVIRPEGRRSSYNWRRDDWKVLAADVWQTMQSNLFKARN